MRGVYGDKPTTQLKVGDRLSINDHDAFVVGTYRRTKEFFWEPVLYTTYSRALSWAPRERQLLSYVLVKVRDKNKMAEIAKRIHERTGLVALTASEFQSLTMWFVLNQTGILVNFGITIFLGVIIGILVSGQLFYTFILDNSRHFAALKAMGVTNRTLRQMIFVQLLTVGSIGYGIGLGCAGIMGFSPKGGELAFAMTWHVPIFSFFAILLCCLLAASLSIRRVIKLEPAIVFKG
jgi:putative ABC transport system permease protein